MGETATEQNESELNESELNGYLVEVENEAGDWSTVGVDATSGTEALRKAAGYSSWEIAVTPGVFELESTEFKVWADTKQEAKEAVLKHAPDCARVIDESVTCFGPATSVKIQEVL